MLKIFSLLALSVFFLTSCAQSQQQATGDKKHFGATIDAQNAISYDDLLQKMSSTDSTNAKVTGKVSEVCQAKGCWMTIISDDPSKPEMRVTFKDYAFFMPKDLSGKRVVIDGKAVMESTSVDILRHYAEDAGKSKEEIMAITEPKRELAFEASGVMILD